MGTRRRIVLHVALPTAALIVGLSVAVAEPSPSVEGTLYAAAPQHQSLEPAKAKLRSPELTPVRDLQADLTASGSEPDPETFDKLGLDHWWTKHQKVAK